MKEKKGIQELEGWTRYLWAVVISDGLKKLYVMMRPRLKNKSELKLFIGIT